MNILETGREYGREEGTAKTLIKTIESAMKNLGTDLQKTCEILGTTVEEYETAKKTINTKYL